MKKIISLLPLLLIVGCAPRQSCPKSSDDVCTQCYNQMKEGGKDNAAMIGIAVADKTDKFLDFLQKSKQYLQEKIAEWKVNNPEMVSRGEKQLAEIRNRIQQYKENMYQWVTE